MKKLLLLLLFSLYTISNTALAQCAMCRATVENNVNNGEVGIASGLNIGILYLFVTPYLIAALIGFLWYKKSSLKKTSIPIQNRIRN